MAHSTRSQRPTARRPLVSAAAGLALAALALTACSAGSGGSSASATSSSAASTAGSTAGATASRTIGADGQLTANEAEFSISLGGNLVAAGPYVVRVNNQGTATHDLVVEKNGTKIAGTSPISPGESASLSVTLQPGDYVFYCSIGNHRSMGMETTVHVR